MKWPNDVLVDGRKVAGILLEGHEGAVVCGIGVNVSQSEETLPRDARTTPGVAPHPHRSRAGSRRPTRPAARAPGSALRHLARGRALVRCCRRSIGVTRSAGRDVTCWPHAGRGTDRPRRPTVADAPRRNDRARRERRGQRVLVTLCCKDGSSRTQNEGAVPIRGQGRTCSKPKRPLIQRLPRVTS